MFRWYEKVNKKAAYVAGFWVKHYNDFRVFIMGLKEMMKYSEMALSIKVLG